MTTLPIPPPRPESKRLLRLVTVVVIVAVLFLARTLLIPIALAVVLAFVLAPVVTRLQQLRLGRTMAVIVAVGTSLAAVAALTWIVAVQAISLAGDLSKYRASVREKVSLLAGQTEGWMSRAREGIAMVREEVLDATDGDARTGGDGATANDSGVARDLDATDEPGSSSSGQSIDLPDTLAHFGEGLLAVGIVVVFVTFMLLKREDLRDRAIAMAGAEHLNVTTQVVDDAATRVSRYLFAQLMVNIGFGAAVAIGLFLIGVPNALLFGALVIPLRFVPVIGLWIAAGLPTLLATLVLDGWTGPLLTIGLFTVVEVVAAYIVEPWAFGHRTGVSTAAILLALVFWTWLWGAPGLVLAMPLTVCLAAIGRHLPNHRWLSVLLDERPALPASARLYQRLLALDGDEALALARRERETNGLAATFDDVFMPALVLLEHDRHGGAIAEERERFALLELRDIIDVLAEEDAATAKGDAAVAPTPQVPGTILCMPARDVADELAALMVAHLLRRRGRDARTMTAATLLSERLAAIRLDTPELVCISAVPPSAEAHARLACRRLAEDVKGPRVVVGMWGVEISDVVRTRVLAAGADIVVSRLDDAVRAIAGEAAHAGPQ